MKPSKVKPNNVLIKKKVVQNFSSYSLLMGYFGIATNSGMDSWNTIVVLYRTTAIQ